jgi:hypothetical protein
MKERPILFNGEMVRAILEGRKTQTRRMCAWQNFRVEPDKIYNGAGYDSALMADYKGGPVICGAGEHTWRDVLTPSRCPFGQPGDRLWVREAFACFDDDWRWPGRPHDLSGGPWMNFHYRADLNEKHPKYKYLSECWRPSIHMPRWASRVTLEITGVRVERLKEITDIDAISEGCSGIEGDVTHYWEGQSTAPAPRAHFMNLWDSINSDRGYGWAANPWIWVVEFRRLP